MNEILQTLAALSIPTILVIVGLCMLGRPEAFDSFRRGAKEGLETAVGLLPVLIALLVGVEMLRASGAVAFVCLLIEPVTSRLGVPSELLPLVLTRPFSGSAATATYAALLESEGADSFPSFCASVIMGSSDTVVYIISVYFSSLNFKKSRHAYPCAFAVMLFSIFFSCLVCRWFAK